MKKIITLLAVVLSLALSGTAAASVDDDPGAFSTPGYVWIEATINGWDANGYLLFGYCRYASYPWGVEQISCWT